MSWNFDDNNKPDLSVRKVYCNMIILQSVYHKFKITHTQRAPRHRRHRHSAGPGDLTKLSLQGTTVGIDERLQQSETDTAEKLYKGYI